MYTARPLRLGCEGVEVRVDCGNRLFEHRPVGRCGRAAELVRGPLARELEGAALLEASARLRGEIRTGRGAAPGRLLLL